MLDADGFAAVHAGRVHSSGPCPGEDALRALAAWVQGLSAIEPFSANDLGERFAPARAYPERASGLVAATMFTDPPMVLMWLRAEEPQVVNWAGNPHAKTQADPEAPLSPRTSFEAWSQTVRGRSRPWTMLNRESADRLMRTIFEARQNRRMRDLNRELIAANADIEALLSQKNYLLKEINHRTQNSLQLVSAFLGLQASHVGDPALTVHLTEAQRRVVAVALVHRRLYGDERVQTVDLGRYLDDLCGEIKSSMDTAWRDMFSVRLAPIIVSADRAINVGLIVTELVINANKYAYGGAPGPISVILEQNGNRFRLIVSDRGGGRTGARQGFGSRMLKVMVAQLDGTAEESGNEPGLRYSVSAPIDSPGPVRVG
jgi:two-component sensor histidine kinase